MTGYGNQDLANNAPVYVAGALSLGSGRTNIAANNTALYGNTSDSALLPRQTVGVFAVDPQKQANTTGEGPKVTSPGWNLRRAWQGPIISGTAVNGSGFANSETVKVSGGGTNGTLVLTTNATSNLVSFSVRVGGVFTNTGEMTYTFNREQHVANVLVSGSTSGFSNTDTISISNGTITGTATISTNSTGGVVNSSFTVTNVGLFPAALTNSQLLVVALAANGAASAGAGATFTGTLGNSSGGTVAVTTLGGRAGRVHYECLNELSSIVANGAVANTILPR